MKNSKGIMINLLGKKPGISPIRYSLLAGSCIIVLILLLFTGYIYKSALAELARQENINARLQASLEDYKVKSVTVETQQSLEQNMLAKQDSINQLQPFLVSHLEVLGEIEKSVPAGILLTELEVETSKAILKGYAPDHNEIARLLSGLRISSCFKSVIEVSSRYEEETDEILFNIEMDWGEGSQ